MLINKKSKYNFNLGKSRNKILINTLKYATKIRN